MGSGFTRHRDRDFEMSKWRNVKQNEEINYKDCGERRPQRVCNGKTHHELGNESIAVKRR